MSKNSHKGNYDKEFKLMVVSMYEEGKTVTRLCSDFELNKNTLYSWINNYSTHKPIYTNSVETKKISNSEVKQMQKELAELKRENDTLKKCVTIFSRT